MLFIYSPFKRGGEKSERQLHKQLRLRPRDEHVARHAHAQAKELLGAREIRQRLAGNAAPHQRLEAPGGIKGQRIGVMGEQPGPVLGRPPERVQQQHPGVEPRHAALLGIGKGALQGVVGC